MNKQRSVILIVIIVFLAFFAIKKVFFSFQFGSSSYTEQYDVFDSKTIDEAEEAIKNDTASGEIDVKLDSVVDGVVKILDFPYPIVFHFNTPFEVGACLVMNEVIYPKSSTDHIISIENLDSTNSVNVSITSASIYSSTSSFFISTSEKYTKVLNYKFSYPVKKDGDIVEAIDSGFFELRGKSTIKSLFSGKEHKRIIEKRKRLNIENKIIVKISEWLKNKE